MEWAQGGASPSSTGGWLIIYGNNSIWQGGFPVAVQGSVTVTGGQQWSNGRAQRVIAFAAYINPSNNYADYFYGIWWIWWNAPTQLSVWCTLSNGTWYTYATYQTTLSGSGDTAISIQMPVFSYVRGSYLLRCAFGSNGTTLTQILWQNEAATWAGWAWAYTFAGTQYQEPTAPTYTTQSGYYWLNAPIYAIYYIPAAINSGGNVYDYIYPVSLPNGYNWWFLPNEGVGYQIPNYIAVVWPIFASPPPISFLWMTAINPNWWASNAVILPSILTLPPGPGTSPYSLFAPYTNPGVYQIAPTSFPRKASIIISPYIYSYSVLSYVGAPAVATPKVLQPQFLYLNFTYSNAYIIYYTLPDGFKGNVTFSPQATYYCVSGTIYSGYISGCQTEYGVGPMSWGPSNLYTYPTLNTGTSSIAVVIPPQQLNVTQITLNFTSTPYNLYLTYLFANSSLISPSAVLVAGGVSASVDPLLSWLSWTWTPGGGRFIVKNWGGSPLFNVTALVFTSGQAIYTPKLITATLYSLTGSALAGYGIVNPIEIATANDPPYGPYYVVLNGTVGFAPAAFDYIEPYYLYLPPGATYQSVSVNFQQNSIGYWPSSNAIITIFTSYLGQTALVGGSIAPPPPSTTMLSVPSSLIGTYGTVLAAAWGGGASCYGTALIAQTIAVAACPLQAGPLFQVTVVPSAPPTYTAANALSTAPAAPMSQYGQYLAIAAAAALVIYMIRRHQNTAAGLMSGGTVALLLGVWMAWPYVAVLGAAIYMIGAVLAFTQRTTAA